jgi:dolichol-phosphate mannosyltransferase
MPDSPKPSVTFIVFALNEEARIEATAETLIQAVKGVNLADFQIVLANDGSTDQTGAIMDRLAAGNPKINVVHNKTNLGQGGAYKHGLTVARCDYVMAVAGDNAATVDSVRSTIEHVGEADIIVPYANNPASRRFIRRIGSRGFSMLLNLLFGYQIPYYNSSVFRRALISTVTVNSNGYAFIAEIAVKLLVNGATHVNVGINYPSTANDYSSALKPKNLKEVLRDVMRLMGDVRQMRKAPARPVSDRIAS